MGKQATRYKTQWAAQFFAAAELTRRAYLVSLTFRQYEALRAYFVDQFPSTEVARRFGYTQGSFRILCHPLRQDPEREFFLPLKKVPTSLPKQSAYEIKSLPSANR